MKYARVLLGHCPEQTAQLFIDYYTGRFRSPEIPPEESPPDYGVPKPRTAFSSFVDHPQEFITFLEALIKKTDLKEEDKIDLYTTLFEMYLDTASRKKDIGEKQEWEDKAKKLIQGKDVRHQLLNIWHFLS